eukprot:CAMPEP_0182913706 /NCGR_PEP_ID=MMETSP0034_2-20130328/38178_1 /TAXON_ID=156128 /ORGANISM="Nephroselmis pyriformis, Strain CCMP717" /LENGTH=144 /DNA_ID=CAMNT_0025050435 /DNA_START=132 /DNA_END=567 /DNA_ORIENTATION=+
MTAWAQGLSTVEMSLERHTLQRLLSSLSLAVMAALSADDKRSTVLSSSDAVKPFPPSAKKRKRLSFIWLARSFAPEVSAHLLYTRPIQAPSGLLLYRSGSQVHVDRARSACATATLPLSSCLPSAMLPQLARIRVPGAAGAGGN